MSIFRGRWELLDKAKKSECMSKTMFCHCRLLIRLLLWRWIWENMRVGAGSHYNSINKAPLSYNEWKPGAHSLSCGVQMRRWTTYKVSLKKVSRNPYTPLQHMKSNYTWRQLIKSTAGISGGSLETPLSQHDPIRGNPSMILNHEPNGDAYMAWCGRVERVISLHSFIPQWGIH